MRSRVSEAESLDLIDEFVEKFESALASSATTPLAGFLPTKDHLQYAEVLTELVRVDLEHAWESGNPRRIEEYRAEFPELFADPERLAAVAFEEYRLRRHSGESVHPQEYQQNFQLDVSSWPQGEPTQSLAGGYGPSLTNGAAQGRMAFPGPGDRFAHFTLVRELGRGAFARVFLAVQDDLANRPVALKISAVLRQESHRLARLQHTNIVPVYSIHREGVWHAVCMPYCGSRTLADVLRNLGQRQAIPTTGKELLETVAQHDDPTVSAIDPVPANDPAAAGDNSLDGAGTHGGVSGVAGSDSFLGADGNGFGRRSGATIGESSGGQAAPQGTESAREATSMFDGPGTTRLPVPRCSYVDAVLWIGVRLADGLAHAHDRGIIHRDLKPANVLLADDGQPLLLDFNLAEDRSEFPGELESSCAGTLPYMAPEQIESAKIRQNAATFQSDVYSLGVMLYEMLALRRPFPDYDGEFGDVINRMIQDRRQSRPALREVNPLVSPAVASIVDHCLQADPNRRYKTAHELCEDLQKQLAHQPLTFAKERSWLERLRKFRYRHPRAVPFAALAVVASFAVILGSFLTTTMRERTALIAHNTYHDVDQELRSIQFQLNRPTVNSQELEEGIAACRATLDRYSVLDSVDWRRAPLVQALPPKDQDKLGEMLGEILLLWSRTEAGQSEALVQSNARGRSPELALRLNELAGQCFPTDRVPMAVKKQRAELLKGLADGQEEAARLLKEALAQPPKLVRDKYLVAIDNLGRGELRIATDLLRQVTREDPGNGAGWIALGHCRLHQGDYAEAAACYSTCMALWPDSHWSYFNRGLAHLYAGQHEQAVQDFDRAAELNPEMEQAFYNCALAHLGRKEFAHALTDLQVAQDKGAPECRVRFTRSRILRMKGDSRQAMEELQRALELEPEDEEGWIARGLARMSTDPQGALGDFDVALEINPLSRAAMEDKAHVLSERLGMPKQAIEILKQVVSIYPEYSIGHSGMGVLLARRGERDAAHACAKTALTLDTRPEIMYQVAGIYALTSQTTPDDKREALRLLAAAFNQNFGLDLVSGDPDLLPLKGDPDFLRIQEAATTLQRASTGDSTFPVN